MNVSSSAITAIGDLELWSRAADDVSAAMIGYRMAQEAHGGSPIDQREVEQIEQTTRSYVAAAKRAFDSDHPEDHGSDCACRHTSIVIVAASIEWRVHGVCFQELARNSLEVMDRYFDRVV